uniref:Ubiquitin carboxyl-terminal hydrolase n=1 Tax=Oryza sativa subsp. japonica TaxID=39947 RepID=Q2QM18_ORYSJ|nr:Ubiquitin carboxyl-terminal hydrolase family protein, expressed [Oryza sativa Japonica Group]
MPATPDDDPPAAASEAPSTSSAAADEDDRVFLVLHRWWREAQEGGGIEAAGVPYAAAPSGPTSYGIGMKVLSMFISDQAFTLRRADDLLQPDASASNAASSRTYALVAADLFSKARAWHIDSGKNAGKKSLSIEEGSVNIYPIMLRVSVTRDTNALTVKISKKDNSAENFKRANKILTSDSEPVHIWDFSGRTTFILMNEWNRMPQDTRSSDQEMPLEIHFYDLSEPTANGTNGKKDELALTMSRSMSNGSIMGMDLDSSGSSKQVGTGLIGLDNLGNTCFMNSAVQCLAHTSKLGELAYSFGDLLRKLWALDRTPVAPRQFKGKLARFAPQFSGFNQHDSQELLAFLLDGLHEDLNRVKCKPYSEAKDSDGRPDEEVADEYWGNHIARNDSIIVDICQRKGSVGQIKFPSLAGVVVALLFLLPKWTHGQYKSTLVCPDCRKVSVTFDPFMYLSLPLPSTTMRTMTITVFNTDGTTGPSPYTVSVPKSGDTKTLIDALSIACSLKGDERLLVAEVYNSALIRYLEEPSEVISLIRDGDRLVAYKLPKDSEDAPIVVFRNQRMESTLTSFGRKSWKSFGTPLVSSLPDTINGSTIFELYQKDNGLEQYNFSSLDNLPEIYKAVLFSRRPQETCSLYACLEAFIKEEPLGPEDMWYCPGCKEHRQASKKLDLWRLPEILIIHLKRFSYSRYTKNKLETCVDFPVHDLDLSKYIGSRGQQISNHYRLYAISNHYGSMGGGHYTAYVYHEGKKGWYDFDDRHVGPISEESIKTSAAYVLFYRRIQGDDNRLDDTETGIDSSDCTT